MNTSTLQNTTNPVKENGGEIKQSVAIIEKLRLLRTSLERLFENQISKTAFTLEESAEMLALSPEAVRRYALKTHELAYCKVGRQLLFRREDILAFLETRRVATLYERSDL